MKHGSTSSWWLAASLYSLLLLAACTNETQQTEQPEPAAVDTATAATNAPPAQPEPPAKTYPPHLALRWETITDKETAKPEYSFDISYPRFHDSRLQPLNEQLENSAIGPKELFASEAIEYAQDVDSDITLLKWQRIFDFEVLEASSEIVSVYLSDYGYAGGAHGNREVHAMMWDVQQGRSLATHDLFRDSSETTYERLAQLVNQNLGAEYAEVMDVCRAGPNEISLDLCFVGHDKLYVCFNDYQLGAYACGSPLVAIPLADTDSLLTDRFMKRIAE